MAENLFEKKRTKKKRSRSDSWKRGMKNFGLRNQRVHYCLRRHRPECWVAVNKKKLELSKCCPKTANGSYLPIGRHVEVMMMWFALLIRVIL